MKFIILAIALASLSGCQTVYMVERQMADGSYVKVTTRSFRKFEQPKLEYETPDGTIFRFNAESASNDYSPVEYAAADVLKAVTAGAIPLPVKTQEP